MVLVAPSLISIPGVLLLIVCLYASKYCWLLTHRISSNGEKYRTHFKLCALANVAWGKLMKRHLRQLSRVLGTGAAKHEKQRLYFTARYLASIVISPSWRGDSSGRLIKMAQPSCGRHHIGYGESKCA